ncbi:MAG TPA: hypothetical protein VNZ48_12225 [Xanthobacteraceae bacterium]|jgi:hypothetical protein|nr:hypothetical protein [Xanthobacteraceae bacterium]
MPAFARMRTAPIVAEHRSPRGTSPASAAAPGARADAAQAGFAGSSAAAAAAINLVVATPCFAGQISVLYAASLFKLQKLLRAYGDVNLKLIFKDGDALITRARASLIAQFLDDPGATHLLFIDADIGFEPEQVLRLLQCGAEMCAAVYPVKRIDWDRVKKTFDGARPNPAAASLQYVFEVEDPAAVISNSGFIKVRYAGTGFLMIRRQALEKMCAQYPLLQYKRDHSLDAAVASDKRFALFECMIAEDGTYLSEDFAFCKRWTDMGGEIWADLDSRLGHVGPMTFNGDLSSQFA